MKDKGFREKRIFHKVSFLNKLFSILTLLFFNVNFVFALPSGQQVVNGNAAFTTQGHSLTITNTPNTIINWQKFSIWGNEAVIFSQQSSSSSVLNRITGQNPSIILGLLQSNGRVFLINPNGIFFGRGAQVNVNGLIASTLDISNQDFLTGNYNFTAGPTAGSIQNRGTITTPGGGSVYLIAPSLENSGIITSPNGNIMLAAGHSVQLVDSSNPDIAVVVSAAGDSAVNLGQIIAQSGKIGIYGGLITQSGTVSADSATVGSNGKIILKATKDIRLNAGSITSAKGGGTISVLADMQNGTVNVAGTLDASAPNGGNGGFIETSAANVQIADTAHITTLAPYGKIGTWLIDPPDFSIAASGGDITGTQLGSELNSTSVEILSSQGTVNTNGSGNINVNDNVTWSANTTLTLSACNNIYVNSGITGTNTGSGLVLGAGNSISGAGIITAGSLYATAETGISLTGLNVVPSVGLFNTTSGDIVYKSSVGSGLYISGINNAATGNFSVTENSGNLNEEGITTNNGAVALLTASAPLQNIFINSNINAGTGAVTLTTSTGAISGSGAITAGTLTASAEGGIDLTGNNVVPTVSLTNIGTGDIGYNSNIGNSETLSVGGLNNASGGEFTVTENSGSITVGAGDTPNITTNGGPVTLTTLQTGGAITIAGNIDTTNGGNAPSGAAVDLNSADAITETGSGVITAGTSGSLSASAVTGITLSNNNVVPTISLTNTGSGTITYYSSMGSGGTLNVSASTDDYQCGDIYIHEMTGGITVDNITTNDTFYTTLTAAKNINVSGNITDTNISSDSAWTLISTAGNITGSGVITTGNLTATAFTGINLDGYNAAPTVILNNTNTGTSGDIIYSSSIGYGNTLFISGQNSAAGKAFTVNEYSGSVTVVDGNTSTTNITTNGGPVNLTTTASGGAINVTGNIDTTNAGNAPSGGPVTITSADAITSSGVITAGTLTASAATGIYLTGDSNTLTTGGAVHLTTTPGGAVTIAGNIDTTDYGSFSPAAVNLTSADSITGNGVITASSLAATAAYGINLGSYNVVPTVILNNTGTGGEINYTSSIGSGLSVSGQNSAYGGGFYITENAGSINETGITTNKGPVTLTTSPGAGAITISGNIDTTNGIGNPALNGALLTLNSADLINGSGIITTSSLKAISETGISLTGVNVVPQLNITAYGGAITVNDTGTTLTDLSITTNGSTNGQESITAANLNNYSVTETGGNTTINTVVDSSRIINFSYENTSGNITVSGLITAGNNVTLTSDNGYVASGSLCTSSTCLITATAATLNAAGYVGAEIGPPLYLNSPYLTIETRGSAINVDDTTTTLYRLSVTTSGNASSQNISSPNLTTYSVADGGGASTINNVIDTSELLSFSYENTVGNITIGTINTGTYGSVSLTSDYGSVSGSGVITAGSLKANAATGISLTGLNVVPQLTLTINGNGEGQSEITVNDTSILTDLSVITDGSTNGPQNITAPGLTYNVSETGVPGGTTTIGAVNNGSNYLNFSYENTGGNIDVNGPITVNGSATSGNVTLTSDSGLVSGSGVITTGIDGSLSVNALNGINLSGLNVVPNVSLTNNGNSGDIIYSNDIGNGNTLYLGGQNSASGGVFSVTEKSGSLDVCSTGEESCIGSNIITNGGPVTLTTKASGGAITIEGNIDTTDSGYAPYGGLVTLTSADAITSYGVITAGTLTASAATGINLTSDSYTLTTGGTVNLTTSQPGGAITIDSYIDTTDNGYFSPATVNLTSADAITGTGVIIAGTLTATANLSAGSYAINLTGDNAASQVSLTNTGNVGLIAYSSDILSSFFSNTISVSGQNSASGGSFAVTEHSGSITETGITTSGGIVTLTTSPGAGAVTISGNMDTTNSGSFSPAPVTLTSADAITGYGVITASALTAHAANSIYLRGYNLVPKVSLTNTGSGYNITYNSNVGAGNTLQVGGSVNDGSFTVTENSGSIDVPEDSSPPNYIHTVGGDVNLTAAQNVTIDSGTNINAGAGSVTLTATSGSINGGGVITASSLTANAATGISLTGANVVPQLYLVATDVGTIDVNDNDTLSVLSVTTNGGTGLQSITGTGLSYNVSDGAAAGDTTTIGAVNNGLNYLNFTYDNTAGNIVVNGPIAVNGSGTSGNVTLTAADSITGSGNITAGAAGTVSLTGASGNISETGAITASTLTATAAAGIDLTGANVVPQLYLEANGGAINVNDTGAINTLHVTTRGGSTAIAAPGLTYSVSGAINTTISAVNNGDNPLNFAYDNTVGSIVVNGPIITDNGSVTLTAAQNITGNGSISAGAGSVTLTGTSGAITDSGTITANFLQATAADGIALTGANVVSEVSLINSNSGNISYTNNGGINVSGANYASVGTFAVSATSGSINVDGISAYSDVTLTAANNINGYGNIYSAAGKVILTGSSGNINETGAITASSLQATAATGITLTGNNAAPKLTLTTTGSGAIDVNDNGATLTELSVTTNGETTGQTITTANNNLTYNVMELNGNTTISEVYNGGNPLNFSFENTSGNIWLYGPITAAGNVTLVSSKNIAIGGAITAGTGAISLTSGNGSVFGRGVITGSSLTASATAGIGISAAQPLNTQVSGLIASNSTSGDIDIDNTGVLTVNGLSDNGTGNGDITLDNVGAVTTAAAISSSYGAVNIIADSPLTIGAGVSAYGDITLTAAASGNLLINGNVTSSAGTVTLAAAGSVTEDNTSSITAGNLTVSAANGISLTGGNEVSSISALNTAANNIAIDNTAVLAVNGLSNSGTGNGDITLNNYGTVTTNAAAVSSSYGTVNITAHSPITIGSGGVSAYGNVALTASSTTDGNLAIDGNVNSSNGNVIMIAGRNYSVAPGFDVSAPKGRVILNGTVIFPISSLTAGSQPVVAIVQDDNNDTVVSIDSLFAAIDQLTNPLGGTGQDSDKDKQGKGGSSSGNTSSGNAPGKPKYCN